MSEKGVKSIQSLARGLKVLQLIQVTGAVHLHDLHRISGIPKASLLRILRTLKEEGLIWQRIVDDAYVASYSLSELANRIDRETRLAEIASPVLERLSEDVKWPSVLAVPRLTHLEVLEANAPRSYFHNIPLGPVGFQINYLRSATGRAYIAECEDTMRDAILDALRQGGRRGDRMAFSPEAVAQIIRETRAQGYGLRDHDFGGDFDDGRATTDDGRDSLGVAIRLGPSVPGAINVTWAKRALNRQAAVDLLADKVAAAAAEIAERMADSQKNFTG